MRYAIWCKRVILPAYLTDKRGRFQTAYNALGVKASSATGLKMGVFRFLPTTHAKTNAKQMSPRSSRTVRRFTRFHLHAKTAVDAGDIRTWRTTVILITGKTRIHLIWAPCRDKMAQVMWSPLYVCRLPPVSVKKKKPQFHPKFDWPNTYHSWSLRIFLYSNGNICIRYISLTSDIIIFYKYSMLYANFKVYASGRIWSQNEHINFCQQLYRDFVMIDKSIFRQISSFFVSYIPRPNFSVCITLEKKSLSVAFSWSFLALR